MPKVSVIIPVYNGEAYLRQCLNTVCAQTLEDIEIICVDDGSSDGSWAILEEYGEKDERFRLLRHEENLYLPAARNTGLTHAEGKYVIFWDCDDLFEPCALEHLFLRAEETGAEICVCSNDLYDHETGKQYPDSMALNLKMIPEGDTFNRFTNPEHILSFTNAVVWNKLFLRMFLIENDIKTPNFRTAEDRPVTFVALCLASKITTVNKVLIHYRWNNLDSQVGRAPQLYQEAIRALDFAVDQMITRDIVPEKSLARRAVQIIRADLWKITTEKDFIKAHNMCTENRGGTNLLQKCNIEERERGYYYNTDDDEYVKHLLHDEPGDLLVFMMYDLYQRNRINAAKQRGFSAELRAKKEELRELKDERKALKSELKETRADLRRTQGDLEALRNSWSFRLGRALLFIPRKLRDLFRRSA